MAAVALILGVCGYVKNKNHQKLAVVTMLLAAGLFFALFSIKMEEYAQQKAVKQMQERAIQQQQKWQLDISNHK